jgi:hypothetical protein
MLKYANAKFRLYMQNLFAYARPAKKLVAGPPRNLSQARQETCYITNNTTNKLNYENRTDNKYTR